MKHRVAWSNLSFLPSSGNQWNRISESPLWKSELRKSQWFRKWSWEVDIKGKRGFKINAEGSWFRKDLLNSLEKGCVSYRNVFLGWSEQDQLALCKLLTFPSGRWFWVHGLPKQVINVGSGSQQEVGWNVAWRTEVITIRDKSFKVAIVMVVMNQTSRYWGVIFKLVALKLSNAYYLKWCGCMVKIPMGQLILSL